LGGLNADRLRVLKRKGFSDSRLGKLVDMAEKAIRQKRHELDVRPVYKRVDTCAAEFATSTAYMYSTYEEECEANPTERRKIMILGGGPNRIGQGIEFDYCCVHAALQLRADGFETIMVNCNPETVSTDYDISDRLYFEPLTLEDVLEVMEKEKPEGVIVQFGGQTPLKLSRALEEAGVPIIGTTPDSIDVAEDRERFQALVKKLNLKQPANATARTEDQAVRLAREVGFPLVVRPSYVLGGRAMEVVFTEDDLRAYMTHAMKVSNDSPVLLDRFLDVAIEVDVDAVCDGEDVLIGGIMEHVEQAGRAARADPQAGQGAERDRPDESAVRDPERRDLRARGESAGLANRAVRFQGDRPGAGENRRAGDDRPEAQGPGSHGRAGPDLFFGQGSRLPIHEVSGGRSHPGARNEVHGRGHGHGPHLWRSLRKGAGRFGRYIAPQRGMLHQRARP
jgi:hypothetical protein